MQAIDIKRFALTGLVAPLGILGAETGAGFGWQEPRAASRLLPLFSFRTGGFRYGVRPFPYVTLCIGARERLPKSIPLHYVTGHLYIYVYVRHAPPPAPFRYVTLRNGNALPPKGKSRPIPLTLTLNETVNVNGTTLFNGPLSPSGAGTAPQPTPLLKPKATSTRSVETSVRQHAPVFGQSTLEEQEGGLCSTPL